MGVDNHKCSLSPFFRMVVKNTNHLKNWYFSAIISFSIIKNIYL